MSTQTDQVAASYKPWPVTVDYADYYGAATIPGVIAHIVSTGRGIFLLDNEMAERRITYGELDTRARQVAHQLRQRGVRPGDRVCLLSTTDEPLLMALFGTWYAGAAVVVLPLPGRRQPIERYAADMRRRIEAAGATLVCVTDSFAEEFGAAFTAAGGDTEDGPVVVSLGEVTAEGGPVLDEPLPDDPDALALLQFTSGTTGPSRAATITHRHLLGNTCGIWTSYGVDPTDPGMIWLPLHHDMGIIGMIAVISRGSDCVLLAPEHFLNSPLCWLVAASRYRVAITTAPNFAYALAGRLLRRSSYELDLSSLRWALNGAEPIDAASLEAFVEAGARYGLNPNSPCPVYGMAEATLAVTLRPPNTPVAVHWVDGDELTRDGRATLVESGAPNARKLVACGYPVPGTEIVIRGEDGTPLPEFTVGEIEIDGPGVMAGYWENKEATDLVIVDGRLRTGDLGYLSPDGLVICGRRKDMIILNGRNLYPEEFETEAERVHGVRSGNTIAFALPGTEHMVLVAETNRGAERAGEVAANLLAELRRTMAVPPTEIVVCPPSTIPKTSSGKRQRGLCRELYLSGKLPVLATAGKPARSKPAGSA
ncbi:MAG: AMP-binding protein [Actinocatenispora sp.]